jgi:hypothetical protein
MIDVGFHDVATPIVTVVVDQIEMLSAVMEVMLDPLG